MKRYFRIIADPAAEDRWFIRLPVDSQGNELIYHLFKKGEIQPQSIGPFKATLRRPGKAVDFNFAAFDVPIVSFKVLSALQEFLGVSIQSWPVDIEGSSASYHILNITDCVDCVDDIASEMVQKWTTEDGRPDLVGHYRGFYKLRIDPKRAAGHHLFRLAGWTNVPAVSEEVMGALTRIGTTGIAFDTLVD